MVILATILFTILINDSYTITLSAPLYFGAGIIIFLLTIELSWMHGYLDQDIEKMNDIKTRFQKKK